MTKEEHKHYLPPTAEHDVWWINTKGWTKVDTPSRRLGDKIKSSYGRTIGSVNHILFEDERDALMHSLSMR